MLSESRATHAAPSHVSRCFAFVDLVAALGEFIVVDSVNWKREGAARAKDSSRARHSEGAEGRYPSIPGLCTVGLNVTSTTRVSVVLPPSSE
jgi:hypothetical protein